MTVTVNTKTGHGMLVLDITGSATSHNLGNILNPEGVALAILDAVIYIDTAGLSTCDMHVGIGATGTGVAQNDLYDNFPIDGTAGTAWKCVAYAVAGGAMTTPALWSPTTYLTFYTDTAYSTGFVGKMFVRYLRLTD